MRAASRSHEVLLQNYIVMACSIKWRGIEGCKVKRRVSFLYEEKKYDLWVHCHWGTISLRLQLFYIQCFAVDWTLNHP